MKLSERPVAVRWTLHCLGILAAVAGLSGTASAQQITGGAVSELLGFVVRGVDSAYDPNSRSYLVVGGHGPVLGICVNEQGVPTSGVITINNVGFGSFPRTKYSPYIHGSGGFLVVWPEEIGPGITQLQSRTVSCTGLMGPEQVVSGPNSAWLESGAALAYSPASRRFLVAWKTYIPDVKATLINEGGTQFGPIVDISSGFGRDPGVTWNSYHDHFGVSYSGETGPNGSVGYSGFALVPAANPSRLRAGNLQLCSWRPRHDHRPRLPARQPAATS